MRMDNLEANRPDLSTNDNKRKAVLYMILSAIGFSFMGVMVRYSGDIPVFEKVFFRNFVSLIIAFLIIKNIKGNGSLFGKKKNQKYLLSRSLMGLGGVVFYFYAINNLVLSDAFALNRISPFFVLIFSWFFLKERITKFHVASFVFVFIGAIMIIKPQYNYNTLPALSGFLSAIFAGGAYTLVRFLKDKESPATIVFYFSLVSVIGMIPLVLLDFKVPSFEQLVYLILTGVCAGAGQFGLTFAYKYSPASQVSIYSYTGIIFSGLLGYMFWGEISDYLAITGAILIIITAVMLYFKKN